MQFHYATAGQVAGRAVVCHSQGFPVPEKTLDTLFHETLKDIYYAERKIATSLRKMARTAQSSDLKAAFEAHEEETQGQIERLTQVFDLEGQLRA